MDANLKGKLSFKKYSLGAYKTHIWQYDLISAKTSLRKSFYKVVYI